MRSRASVTAQGERMARRHQPTKRGLRSGTLPPVPLLDGPTLFWIAATVRAFMRPVALLSVFLLATSGLAWAEADDAQERFRLVERVIDGDTLVLDGGERVRLIGVDTPETVHPQKPVEYFGKEASTFTRSMVEGKRVRLEYGEGTGRSDRYGRTLAYVYLANGTLLNREIIEQGYGHAYTRPGRGWKATACSALAAGGLRL